MSQPHLLRKVLNAFHSHHIDYMITGSIVSSLQGEPRATHDIDIVIAIPKKVSRDLTMAFPPPRYYISQESIIEAIKHESMFNLIDTETGDKVDFWLLTGEPFDRSRFSRRYEETVWGLKMVISAPEDTILAKLKWDKMAGGSQKQFYDALRVYEMQFNKLDLEYITMWAKNLRVQERWNELRQKAHPLKP